MSDYKENKPGYDDITILKSKINAIQTHLQRIRIYSKDPDYVHDKYLQDQIKKMTKLLYDYQWTLERLMFLFQYVRESKNERKANDVLH